MAKGQFKLTLAEVRQMVDEFLELHQKSLDEAKDTGNTAHLIPGTRAQFVRYWQDNGNQYQRQITNGMINNWVDSSNESENVVGYAEQIARIDSAGSAYFEVLALINPKLVSLAQFGSKQACYGGYKDKPENSICINVANKGAKVDWGK